VFRPWRNPWENLIKSPPAFAADLFVPIAAQAADVDAHRDLLRIEAALCHAVEIGDAAVTRRARP
jgi:hypothetical protein